MKFFIKIQGVYFIIFILICQALPAQNTPYTDSTGEPVPRFLLKKISVVFEKTALSEALNQLSEEGELYLNYNSAIIPLERKISLKLKDSPVVTVLHKVLEGSDIGFVVTKGNQIVLVPTIQVKAMMKYTVSGFISDAESGEALMGTNVYIKELKVGVTSNMYGFYSLTIPSGRYSLIYSYIGYEVFKIDITVDENITQDIELTARAISGDTVMVNADMEVNMVRTTELGTIKLIPKENSAIPALLGEQDIFRTIHLLPGISQAREADAGYYVRGGNSDQNLVLLDEAPVYNAVHFLGSFSIFNTDAIKDVKLIKGSAPARYGGKLSSVLDIQMKEGNAKKFGGNAAIGLIFSRLTLEGPLIKNKSSYMVSGRRTYADIFTKLSSEKDLQNSKLYFYDFNLKSNYRAGNKDRFYLSGYFGKDVLGVAPEEEDEHDFNISWGNATGTLRWNHLFNEKLFSNTSLIYSRFRYSMMDEGEGEKVEVSSVINDLTLKSDFQYFANPKSSLNFGLHYIHHTYQPSEMIIDGDEYFYILVGKRKADEVGIYLSQEWKASKRFSSEFGFRYSLFLVSGQKDIFDLSKMDEIPHEFYDLQFHQNEHKMYGGFEPRLSVNYLLNSTNSLKFGYARNYQNVHLLSNSTSGTPLNVWHPSSSTIKPQRADQISLGYFRHLAQKNMELSCEFFYKDMKNQLDFKDGADIFLSSLFESEVARGRGWAYGMELFLKRRYGRFTGWVGYTLSRSQRQFAEINNGKAYPASNDRPHDFAIVCLYQIHERLTFSANWVYHTGSPVTVPYGKYQIDGKIYTAYTARNAYRMPVYHRLDIGLTYQTKRRGTLNFTLYNAYGRKNAYAILIRENEGNPNNIETIKLSLFSFIPSISYNFTF